MGNFLMKKVKKALIATSLAGALVASAGFGTYSWFTAEKSGYRNGYKWNTNIG
jgi:hypothetical protein